VKKKVMNDQRHEGGRIAETRREDAPESSDISQQHGSQRKNSGLPYLRLKGEEGTEKPNRRE